MRNTIAVFLIFLSSLLMQISICMDQVVHIQPCSSSQALHRKNRCYSEHSLRSTHKWNEEAKKNADILFGASEHLLLLSLGTIKTDLMKRIFSPLSAKKYFTGKER